MFKLLYTIIKEEKLPELARAGQIIETSRGDMQKVFLGDFRVIKNRITGRVIVQEAYKISSKHFDSWECRFFWSTSSKTHWQTVSNWGRMNW